MSYRYEYTVLKMYSKKGYINLHAFGEVGIFCSTFVFIRLII